MFMMMMTMLYSLLNICVFFYWTPDLTGCRHVMGVRHMRLWVNQWVSGYCGNSYSFSVGMGYVWGSNQKPWFGWVFLPSAWTRTSTSVGARVRRSTWSGTSRRSSTTWRRCLTWIRIFASGGPTPTALSPTRAPETTGAPTASATISTRTDSTALISGRVSALTRFLLYTFRFFLFGQSLRPHGCRPKSAIAGLACCGVSCTPTSWRQQRMRQCSSI